MPPAPLRPHRGLTTWCSGVAPRLAILVAIVTSIASASADGQPMQGDGNTFAVHDVNLFDGERQVVHANVVVRDGRIVAAATGASIPAGVPVVEGANRSLLPGLIDAHTHTYGAASREALRFGVTTELDMFTDWHALAAARAQRESLARTEQADLWSAGTLATVPGGHGTEYGVAIPTLTRPDEAQAWVAARVAEGSDYIKIVLEDGSAYGHTLPSLDGPTTKALVAAAHARGKMALTHVATQADALLSLDAGVDGLAHVFLDRPADAAFVARARAAGIFIVPTLSVASSAAGAGEGGRLAADARLRPWLSTAQLGILTAGFPPDWRKPAFLPNALESVRVLHAAGVPLLAGTDAGNPGTTHGASLHGELELLVRAGLSPIEALRAATATPARIFALADRGRIAPGMRADLLLVDGDPTLDITATRSIAAVWKNGFAVGRALRPDERPDTAAAPAAPTDPVIADFEQQGAKARFGQDWQVTTDQIAGGNSTATQTWKAGGADGSAGALAVQGEIGAAVPYAWAGSLWMAGAQPMQAVDLSGRKELVFKVRGDGRENSAMLFSGQATQGRPAIVRFKTGSEWREVRIPLDQFTGADLSRLRAIAFVAAAPAGRFEFEIDDIALR